MLGGSGNDTFYIDNVRDQVIELAGEGVDTVRSSVSFTLPDHVENLELLDGATTGIGNDQANIIAGNAGKNTLVGGAGNDMFFGLGGKDILEGGPGADRFVWLELADGTDIIRDFNPAAGDVLDFSAVVTDFAPKTSDVGDFLRLTGAKKATKLALDVDGDDGPAGFQVVAVLFGFDATTTTVDQLFDYGSIVIA